jgi:predicted GIY-YIG superfamily endonuclease
LIYSEFFETEAEAIEREKYLKTAAGRRFIKKKLAG